MSYSKYDEKIAKSTHERLNCTGITENAVFPKDKEKENYQPRTLVDETLEYIDPTPNIHTLFVQFNAKFFWNVLLPVQVKWSPRMTSCAGICTFHPRNRECVITLSTPLLKLRPRKDLIETLLHEMIHAYLFLTNNNRDRDGHGPVFQSHMKRINGQAGTNITIYHSFHEEVRLYQQHWWRCNGPCQKRAPYFGTVRRSMNRAPGPNDFWWKEHQMTCGGQFIKIKEPEKPDRKNKNNSKASNTNTIKKTPEKSNILNWINKVDNKSGNKQSKKNVNTPKGMQKNASIPKNPNESQKLITSGAKNNSFASIQTTFKKLGNTTNNVHGWGTGGPNSTSSSSANKKPNMRNPIASSTSSNNVNTPLSFSGTLGGTGTGKSILLDKYCNVETNNTSEKSKSKSNSNFNKTNLFNKSNPSNSSYRENSSHNNIVECPNCNQPVDESKINDHLDKCLLDNKEKSKADQVISNKKRKQEDNHMSPKKNFKSDPSRSNNVECPLCEETLKVNEFNKHLDNCAQNNLQEDAGVSNHDSSSTSIDLHDSPHFCLICEKALEPGITLNDHLEECVASVFNDSGDDNNDDFIDLSKSEENVKKKEDSDIYPCPVCMKLVKSLLMNDHLDICLAKPTGNVIIL